MSFASEFNDRWEKVIKPTIREKLKLEPNRVDYNQSGESVIHDILDGISHSRLIIADITSTSMKDNNGKIWPQRNGNVMWEVGIAHVMRLPDEVILVRSDTEPSIFDLTQFRAFSYDPSNFSAAREFLQKISEDRLKVIDQSKSDFVRNCADSLDPHSALCLFMQVPIDGSPFEIKANMLNAMQFPKLFEHGIIRAESYEPVLNPTEGEFPKIDIKYCITPFGQNVVKYLSMRMGIRENILNAFKER